jgi:hypothetical protein
MDFEKYFRDGKLYLIGPAPKGQICIIESVPECPENVGDSDRIEAIEKMIAEHPKKDFVPVESLSQWWIHDYEKTSETDCECTSETCYECGIDGYVEYTDSRGESWDIVCPVCDSDREIRSAPNPDCERCDGEGVTWDYPDEAFVFDDRCLNKKIVRELAELPGCRVSLGGTTAPHYFDFEHGEGVFMGMKP